MNFRRRRSKDAREKDELRGLPAMRSNKTSLKLNAHTQIVQRTKTQLEALCKSKHGIDYFNVGVEFSLDYV